MKKSVLIPTLSLLIGFGAASAHADVKIGYVDMNKIFSSYTKTKDAEKKINDARSTAKEELDKKLAEYRKNVEEINKLNQELEKPELSKEVKDRKLKERDEKFNSARSQEREINEYRQLRERSLQEQAMRMREDLVKVIREKIAEKVKSAKYDLVLDRSGNSLNGVPVVLYSPDTADFSDEIIKSLNAGGDDAKAASSDKKK